GLPRAVLGRIVKDEAAHGVFGFTVLDWADDLLDDADRAHLGKMADLGIDFLYRQWDDLAKRPKSQPHDGDVLQWMQTDDYLALAYKSLERDVMAPLRARKVPLEPRALPDRLKAPRDS